MPVTASFSRRVPLDKAVVRAAAPSEGAADAVVGEGGADEVQSSGASSPQVDGQAGLVLAAPGTGHILSG